MKGFNNARLMTTPPHITALLEHGGFKPIYSTVVKLFDVPVKLPVIWQKIK